MIFTNKTNETNITISQVHIRFNLQLDFLYVRKFSTSNITLDILNGS